MMDSLGDDAEQVRRFERRQRVFTHELCQARAINQVHCETRLILVVAGFMDRHDRGVAQGCGGPGLRTKTFNKTGIRPTAKKQHLEGDNSIQGAMPSPKNYAHTSLTEFF